MKTETKQATIHNSSRGTIIARDGVTGEIFAERSTNCNPVALHQIILEAEVAGYEIDWVNSAVSRPDDGRMELPTAKIYRSFDDKFLGEVESFPTDRFEGACENPEGHVRAGAVLDDCDLESLGIDGDTTIYAVLA